MSQQQTVLEEPLLSGTPTVIELQERLRLYSETCQQLNNQLAALEKKANEQKLSTFQIVCTNKQLIRKVATLESTNNDLKTEVNILTCALAEQYHQSYSNVSVE